MINNVWTIVRYMVKLVFHQVFCYEVYVFRIVIGLIEENIQYVQRDGRFNAVVTSVSNVHCL